jgi:predicted MPP superfamily phosphohydrolase
VLKISAYLLLFLLLVGIVGYGAFVEPNRLDVTQHTLGIASASPLIRVAQISDLHLQAMDDIRHLVAQRTVLSKPDVIVFSGDIVDSKASLPALEIFLSELGDIPKVAVLGNWEYWSEIDFQSLRELYGRHHTTLLVNSCLVFQFGNQQLAFIGLDDALAGKPNLRKAERSCVDVDSKILIEHSPGFFGKPLDQPVEHAPYLLGLSGHTHGGQILIFGQPMDTPPGSGEFNRGWYETKYGKLYVSRGIGTTVLPLRIGSAPELAVFDMHL